MDRQDGLAFVVLDEAQVIKNPNAKQTKAVKSLSAKGRIVLTGTPIENNLRDLWSIFDFLNPGLLGSSQGFRQFREAAGLGSPMSPTRRCETGAALYPAAPQDRQEHYADLPTRPRSRPSAICLANRRRSIRPPSTNWSKG